MTFAPRNISVVYNPVAGRARGAGAVPGVRAALERGGFAPSFHATTGPGGAVQLARDLCSQRPASSFDLVALGGDGTLNELAWGAWLAAGEAGSSGMPRLGVLPAGSTNVVARDLGLPLDPARAAARLSPDRDRSFDMGMFSTTAGQRPFLLGCGVGYDAEAVAGVSPRLKRLLGRAAYVVSGLLAFTRSRPALAVEATCEDGTCVSGLRAASLLVANTRHYGGEACLSRAAAPDDGVIEVAVLRSAGPLSLLHLVARALTVGVEGGSSFRVLRIRSASIDAPEPVACHVDAEAWGTTPARLEVLPLAVTLLAPA